MLAFSLPERRETGLQDGVADMFKKYWRPRTHHANTAVCVIPKGDEESIYTLKRIHHDNPVLL